MRFRALTLAAAFVSLVGLVGLVHCSGGSGGTGGACLQASDVCTCSCGGDEVTGLSSEPKPDCASWQGVACGDGGLTYASCGKTGTKCWSP
jgi:hypothetical protein